MASIVDKEVKVDRQGLTVRTTTTALREKSSAETFSSTSPSPAVNGKETTLVLARPSDVSTPASTRGNPFDTDVEAIVTNHSETRRSRVGSDCQVWPGMEHWRRKARAAKRSRRSCTCLDHLSKRNRILVKVLIALLIVGIAVGVGFGVSKPLGAGIWQSNRGNGQ